MDEETSIDDNNTQDYEQGDRLEEKPTIDLLFDTEIILKTLQRSLEGKDLINEEWVQVRLPIARDEIISLIINSLRSIINPSNSLSYVTYDDARISIYEKILEFEYLLVEEPTISNTEFETIINMCDHSLELFYGKVIDGHLSKIVGEIYTGTRTPVDMKSKDGNFLNNWFKNK